MLAGQRGGDYLFLSQRHGPLSRQAFWAMVKLSPFSIRQELETDHNTAVAILMASVILGLAIIIAAALHG